MGHPLQDAQSLKNELLKNLDYAEIWIKDIVAGDAL